MHVQFDWAKARMNLKICPSLCLQAMVNLAWACAMLQFRDISLLAGIADMGEPYPPLPPASIQLQ